MRIRMRHTFHQKKFCCAWSQRHLFDDSRFFVICTYTKIGNAASDLQINKQKKIGTKQTGDREIVGSVG